MNYENINSCATVAPLTALTTTETAFPAVTGGTARAFVSAFTRPAANTGNIARGNFIGRCFYLRAVLKLVSGNNSTFTVNTKINTGNNANLTTFTGDTTFHVNTFTVTGSSTYYAYIIFQLYINPVTRVLSGFASSQYVFGTAVGWSLINSSVATLANFTSAVSFFMTATSSAANVGDAATLLELTLDQ